MPAPPACQSEAAGRYVIPAKAGIYGVDSSRYPVSLLDSRLPTAGRLLRE